MFKIWKSLLDKSLKAKKGNNMEIKVNKDLTIYCDIEISYFCGNAYHNIEIFKGMNCLLSKHIHGCENGYEAILEAINSIDNLNVYLYKRKNELYEVVSNHYLESEVC